MAQLDRFIATIFNFPDARLHVAAGSEPTLLEGRRRVVLVGRVLQAVQVRFLLGELLDDAATAKLEAAGMLDGVYAGCGQPVLMKVRSWHTEQPEATFMRPPTNLSIPAPATHEEPAEPEPVTAPHPAEVDVAPSPPPASLEEFLAYMVREQASDLHLPCGQPPMVRKAGSMLRVAGAEPLTEAAMLEFVRPTLPPRNRQEFEADSDTDFAYEAPNIGRFRINLFRDRLGPGLVARAIPTRVLSAEELKLPASVRNLSTLSKGLVLVTGPTGSGKSTTLAALIDLINREREDHIITLEDPIEFIHTSQKCLINQREVGAHTRDFKRALRAALREDPDVVLVGELRDLETTAIALETAETGHLVFGTLHTSTAPGAVDRMIDQFPPEQQAQVRVMLAESLRGVVAQTLCRRADGQGRVAALEILLGTTAVANLIRESKLVQLPSVMQTSRKAGMRRLNDSLVALVSDGVISVQEAHLRAVDKAGLTHELAAAGFPLEGGTQG